MLKRHFDLIIIVPLEEELQEVMGVFDPVENLVTEKSFRYVVKSAESDLSILVVQQDGMGKASASRAVSSTLQEFSAGLIVVLGIAGSMSPDMRLGDVCYTGTILDVYDNAKALDEQGNLDIEFSPTHHKTWREITTALNFIRTVPELKPLYNKWQEEQERFAQTLLSGPVKGRGEKDEVIGRPHTASGAIVCGVVSKSEAYNKKLRGVDRKILAIETESGAAFDEAFNHHTPAVAIRGISDYADLNKGKLEQSSSGGVRKIAANNAATFLRLQLSNRDFVRLIVERRAHTQNSNQKSGQQEKTKDLAVVLMEIGQDVDSKLRELSPEFRLQPKGYRLPTPRVREVNFATNLSSFDEVRVLEVREAIEGRSTILLNLSRTYPDNSLPWVLADDLLTATIEGKQPIPLVIDGAHIRPPRGTLASSTYPDIAVHLGANGTLPIFIIHNVPLESKTRINFLVDQAKEWASAKFIFITRSEASLLKESEFVGKLAAAVFSVSDVSFREIAHFIQKNFSMSGSEAEVIALRLRNTFNAFNLSAHPTYFAGIPRETLSALLQANRRSELIQLAVDGFLTFVVAGDKADVALSRTTRSRFLRKLAVAINVEKRTFDHEQIVAFTREFAAHYDFDIDPIGFVQAFVEKGILRFEGDKIQFSLPFIESYLLAAELRDRPEIARDYFRLDDSDFDDSAFDIYAELGASEEMVREIIRSLEGRLSESVVRNEKHILLTDDVRPKLLGNQDRLRALQSRLKKAVDDVQNNRDDKERKQKTLDIADRIREAAAARSEQLSTDEDSSAPNKRIQDLGSSVRIWFIGTILLGSGAEHLDAQTKQLLAKLLIQFATLLLDDWTRLHAAVDFEEIKKELMLAPENSSASEEEETKRVNSLISNLVDVLEFSFLGEPLRRLSHAFCEQARHKVLAPSVQKAKVEGVVEAIVYGAWLTDIDSRRGKSHLTEAIKALPPAPFLRLHLASHFLTRAYWSHSRKEDRLTLLDAAEDALKPIQMGLNKQELQRKLESGERGLNFGQDDD